MPPYKDWGTQDGFKVGPETSNVEKVCTFFLSLNSEGEKCHKSQQFREILPNVTPGHLFMLGGSAASKIIYVRPVGSPESTSNVGQNPNIK